MIKTLTSRTLLAAAVAAVFATNASAQVRQVPMGTNLDANPNVNSGGSNQPVSGYVPINGNDIITGNVGGLGYFHGRTGISSPYTFRGNLGTSSLSNFARQSALPAKSGAPTTYYLPSNTVSTGQGSLYSAPTGSGFDSRIVPVTSFSPTASSTQIRALNGAVQGQAYNRVPPPSLPGNANPEGGALNNPIFAIRTTAELERLRQEQAKQNATRPAETPSTQPTLQVQERIDASRGPDAGARSPEQRGGMALDGRAKGDVGEVYARLAEELKDAAGIPAAPQQPTEVSLVNTIDPLTGRPRPQAPSVASATGGTGKATTTRPGKTATDRVTSAVSAKPLEDLTTAQLTAGSKVKPLKIAPTPSGSVTPSEFALLMIRGEQSLKDGKYIDAQIAYQTAMAKKPDDALALVGLAHAEMGAGAYVPATYDLKFLFTRKPEMIAVRYDPSSFIPVPRQEQILAELQRQMNNKENSEMARFLFCYICYQTGRLGQLETELKKWGGLEGHDSWQPILSRAWRDPLTNDPALKEPAAK